MNIDRAIEVVDVLDKLTLNDGISAIHLFNNGLKKVWISSDKLWHMLATKPQIDGDTEICKVGSVTLARTLEDNK